MPKDVRIRRFSLRDKLQIINDYELTQSYRKVAEKWNCHFTSVSLIVKNNEKLHAIQRQGGSLEATTFRRSKFAENQIQDQIEQCEKPKRISAENKQTTKQKTVRTTDLHRGGATFEVNPLVAKRAGSSFVIKSRLLNRISFTHLEETADAIDFRNECTIFVLPCITEDEGPKLHCLRCLLQSEAVCLEREQQRVWRLTVDSSTVLTKLVQLGFGVASSCVDADGVHTWTLVGLDEDGSGEALSATERVKNPSKKRAVKSYVAGDRLDPMSAVGHNRSTRSLEKFDTESDEHADEDRGDRLQSSDVDLSVDDVAETPEKRRLSHRNLMLTAPPAIGKKLRSRVYNSVKQSAPVNVNHTVNILETTRSEVLKADLEENDESKHANIVHVEKLKPNAVYGDELDECVPGIRMDGNDLSRLLSTVADGSVNDSHCSTLSSGQSKHFSRENTG